MSDFLNSIKIRISQPFILSFIIGWIIFNWEIVVALIWYRDYTIHYTGYGSFILFIENKLTVRNSFLLPLLSSVFYPVVRLIFSSLYSWIRSWNERAEKFITKGGFITVKEYLDMQDVHDQNIQKLSKLINEKSKIHKELSEQRTKVAISESLVKEVKADLLELRTLMNQSNDARRNMQMRSDVIVFNGQWDFELAEPNGKGINTTVSFVDGQASLIFEADFFGRHKGTVKMDKYILNTFSRHTFLKLKFQGVPLIIFDAKEVSMDGLIWNEDFTVLETSTGGEGYQFKMTKRIETKAD